MVFFLLCSGCTSDPSSNWVPMDSRQAIGILKDELIFFEEMENIKGKERCIGLTICDYLYLITFDLPQTMAPEDWLKYIVLELQNNGGKMFEKKDTYHYSIDYENLPSNYDDNLKYNIHEEKYEFRAFWSE